MIRPTPSWLITFSARPTTREHNTMLPFKKRFRSLPFRQWQDSEFCEIIFLSFPRNQLGPVLSTNDTWMLRPRTRRCIQYLQSNSIMDITPSKCAAQLPHRRLLRELPGLHVIRSQGELSSAFTWVLAPHRVLHTIESILLDTIALHIAEVNLLSFSGEGEFSQGSFKHSYLELHASLVQRRWTAWHADCCFIF